MCLCCSLRRAADQTGPRRVPGEIWILIKGVCVLYCSLSSTYTAIKIYINTYMSFYSTVIKSSCRSNDLFMISSVRSETSPSTLP